MIEQELEVFELEVKKEKKDYIINTCASPSVTTSFF